MPTYKSLLGYECITSSSKIIKYPHKLIELFTDPITKEIMTDPIILFEYPQNVYDRNSLFKWLSESDLEPLLNIRIGTKLHKIKKILNYYMAMLLLEDNLTELIFHVPNIDIFNLMDLVSMIVKSKNCAQNKFSNDEGKNVYLDIKHYQDYKLENYEGFEPKVDIFHDFLDYDIHDILTRDLFTKKNISKLSINKDGLYHDSKKYKNAVILRIMDIHLHLNDELNSIILVDKINSFFKEIGIVEKTHKIIPVDYWEKMNIHHANLFYFERFFNTKIIYEYQMESTSVINTYIKKLEQIKLDKDKYINFESKQNFLSNIVRNNPDLVSGGLISNPRGLIANYKKDIEFPLLTNLDNCYEEDFSLLDLSGLFFIGKSTTNQQRVQIKSRYFLGSDLRGSYFENFMFNCSEFMEANLEGATFKNCEFYHCNFDNANMNKCNTIDLSGDEESLSNLYENIKKSLVFNKKY